MLEHIWSDSFFFLKEIICQPIPWYWVFFFFFAYNILYHLQQLLDKIFDKFARLWMSMKVQAKSKSDCDAQQYKFKPRAFKIESVVEVDISTLSNSFANETFSEWKEFSSEEISIDKVIDNICFVLHIFFLIFLFKVIP